MKPLFLTGVFAIFRTNDIPGYSEEALPVLNAIHNPLEEGPE